MADISKLRRRGTLGAPPPPAEASPNLAAPEVAPVPPRPSPQAAQPELPPAGGAGEGTRLDGRSARRTGRTLQFATRVSPEFDQRVRAIAAREGILLVEVLERALDAYEASRSK